MTFFDLILNCLLPKKACILENEKHLDVTRGKRGGQGGQGGQGEPGGPRQYIQMPHGEGGLKSAKKVSPIRESISYP
jgi:hypothetical protein